jgi:inner membrane protein
MPSPILHSVTGYVIGRIPLAKRLLPKQLAGAIPVAALYGIAIANLPDLDFIPQVLTGLRFHRGPSHSLLAAVLVSALLAFVMPRLSGRLSQGRLSQPTAQQLSYQKVQHTAQQAAQQIGAQNSRSPYSAWFSLTFGLYALHLVMDFFTAGGNGIPVLWPVSQQFFKSPWPLFPAVHHSLGLWHNAHWVFISIELLYALFLLGAMRSLTKRPSNNPQHRPSAD